MADLKAMFRAAAKERGSAAPTKEQLRALKDQKAAQKKAGDSQPAPSTSSRPQPQAPAPSKPAAQGLPSDFFEQPDAKRRALSPPSTSG
eukprot:CAMPEP_0202914742 /NCGR_PEP_ID=MMETSP1392-20130828/63853_1 /ASSEMBLY_ACC=CAM_ASM_000868 /TAXON_ID=225041 /ORGANISM="Chlamydomonas chlamydogama, Strain SAG 11-48b" /LENGTH=88 /DNA_ID=CAMNT_0049606515 /DNA_START=4 /DNA_END=266 /DNA_ORIENTATION=-